MPTSPRHSVSVAAIILDNTASRVLLICRRDNGHWEPPGGVLELDESIDDGLRREVYEETGTTIDVDYLTGVYKNLNLGVVALVFRATLTGEPDHRSAEATTVQWHDLDTIDHVMDEAYAIRVHDATATVRPHVRAHDGTTLLS